MHIKVSLLLLALAAGCLTLVGTHASDHSYVNNVSDVEVEDGVKGETYNKGPVNYFGGSDKKEECSACAACAACATAQTASSETASVTTATTTTTTAGTASNDGRHIKYILDGKPVYEEGAKGDTGETGAPAVPGEALTKPSSVPSGADITQAIDNLGNASWRDAQALLIQAGKAAVPQLIGALDKPGVAYNLAGHTKADAGRAPRQLTIADVCAGLLEEIINNHSNYKGELPGANQQAWQEWWTRNGQSVTFGS